MSYSISDLMIRNLRDVFGENDPARRRAAIDELWAEDGVFYDPNKGAIRGRDAIDRIAGAVKATHPDFRYQMTAAPQEYCDAGMVPWISGRPGEVPAYSGRDFVIARDGRIVALYMFFDKAALSSSLPSEGHHLMLMRRRYGEDVAIFENRDSALSSSSHDGNRNEAAAYRG
ncbi:MAG: nuclear transport factor 2 family protein [Terriglobales bacterium]